MFFIVETHTGIGLNCGPFILSQILTHLIITMATYTLCQLCVRL